MPRPQRHRQPPKRFVDEKFVPGSYGSLPKPKRTYEIDRGHYVDSQLDDGRHVHNNTSWALRIKGDNGVIDENEPVSSESEVESDLDDFIVPDDTESEYTESESESESENGSDEEDAILERRRKRFCVSDHDDDEEEVCQSVVRRRKPTVVLSDSESELEYESPLEHDQDQDFVEPDTSAVNALLALRKAHSPNLSDAKDSDVAEIDVEDNKAEKYSAKRPQPNSMLHQTQKNVRGMIRVTFEEEQKLFSADIIDLDDVHKVRAQRDKLHRILEQLHSL